MVMPTDFTFGGVDVTSHEFENRRLPGTVRADERDSRVTIDTKLEILQQHSERRIRGWIAEGDVLKGQYRRCEFRTVRKRKLKRLFGSWRWRQASCFHFI